MKANLLTTFAVIALSSAAAPAFAASAQPDAWVSGLGADATGCGATSSPCRTFQFAYSNVVASGGSIYVKDSSDYSPIVISHAISIINDSGATATVVATSGDAIDIEAAGANVHLRGLTLDGAGKGANGVNFIAGSSLTVEKCTIKGFIDSGDPLTGNGILFGPSTGTTRLTVTDTVVSGNAVGGVLVLPNLNGGAGAKANVSATLTRVDTVNNQFGVVASGVLNAGTESVIATEVNANQNVDGFYAEHGAVIFLSRSTATGNTSGVYPNTGSKINTYGDNAINGNTTDVSGALTHVALR